jgi:hypothetical protein
MTRLLAAAVVAALVAPVALADIPPPPPPKGKRYINVTNQVFVAKDVTGFVFVEEVTEFRPGPQPPTYKKLDLNAEKPVTPTAAARRISVALLAVPKAAADEFKSDKDLFEALKGQKVKGVARTHFTGTATVSDAIKGDTVKWTVTVTGVGAKGITTKTEGEGFEVKKGVPDGEDGTEEPVAAPRNYWIAGAGAALALMLGGLWLVGRARRS